MQKIDAFSRSLAILGPGAIQHQLPLRL
uniref:Uncharacterized protein n=1 Tax=Arundo donax TaxID=35708 RepID=A0A0A9EH52_ARUDO